MQGWPGSREVSNTGGSAPHHHSQNQSAYKWNPLSTAVDKQTHSSVHLYRKATNYTQMPTREPNACGRNPAAFQRNFSYLSECDHQTRLAYKYRLFLIKCIPYFNFNNFWVKLTTYALLGINC